jgi:hypothetical protein
MADSASSTAPRDSARPGFAEPFSLRGRERCNLGDRTADQRQQGHGGPSQVMEV